MTRRVRYDWSQVPRNTQVQVLIVRCSEPDREIPQEGSTSQLATLIDDVVADLSKRGVAFRALRDGEAILVHGDDERVVGSGIGG